MVEWEAVASVGLPFFGAGIGYMIMEKDNSLEDWYEAKLKKPWWRPRTWMYGPVWSLMYAIMGYAAFLVWREGGGFHGDAKIALASYGISLICNWSYTPLFFGLKKLAWATLDVILLNVSVVIVAILFWPISPVASYLFVPVILWVTWASALNVYIYTQNSSKPKAQ